MDSVMAPPYSYPHSIDGFFVGTVYDSNIYNCASIINKASTFNYQGFAGSENSGTIENCYVHINEIVDFPGVGGYFSREGITYNNHGEIYNCYYNRDIYAEDYGDNNIIVFDDYLPYSLNDGIVDNSCSYSSDNGHWQLSESIVINNNSTDDLVEALNLGVEKLEAEGHECLDWKMTPVGQLGDLVLPVLDFDSYLSTSETIISDNKIAIYPNPAQTHINIEAENIDQVEIYNTMGQMLNRIDVNANDIEIDISGYQSGIYLIKTIAKDGISVNKVVKM